MEVYWNGQLLRTQIPNTTATTLEIISVIAIAGDNVIKFQDIGPTAQGDGMFID
jgi:hypothetical protein